MKKQIPLFIISGILLVSACIGDPKPQEPTDVITHENPAINSVSDQILHNPNDPELYLSRASLYYENEDYDDAIKDMKKAMSFDSSSIAFRHVLADIYLDANQRNDALGLLEETITLFPASKGTLLKLSEFQYLLELNDAALATTDKLMEVSPEHTEGYFMKGRIYWQMGNNKEAIRNFKKALDKDPKHFDSLLELGTLYSSLKSKEALTYLDKAQELSPNNPDIIFEKGNYHRFRGEDKEALEFYKQVVFIDNQYTDAHINAGIIKMDADDYKQALNFFNIAVETDPTSPSAYYFRGMAAAYMGDKNKAKADLQTALDLAPNYEDAKEALMKLD